ncbi:MAG: HAMP domain-containing protein, partial [Acidimicrobiales bacterium]
MSPAPVQVEFAVEFASFLVAAAGFALVLLRAEDLGRTTRDEVALALGFAALAVVAFLHGSLLVPSATAPVTGLRVAGLALLLLGSAGPRRLPALSASARWKRPPVGRPAGVSRLLLWLGVAFQAGALGALAAAPLVADALLGTGAVGIGAALALSSRRSVAGRVAASAGGTLLALVLVLSVALSAVLSSTVRNEATHQLDARAGAEASQVRHLAYVALPPEALLLTNLVQRHLDSTPGCAPSSRRCIAAFLPTAATTYLPSVDALWVVPGTRVGQAPDLVAQSAGAAAGLGSGTALAVARSPAVAQALRERRSTASTDVVNGRAVVLAATPDVVTLGTKPASPTRLVGAAVVVTPLDAAYLRQQRQLDDPSVSLGVVGNGSLVASSGSLPPPGALTSLVSSALAMSRPGNQVLDGQFVAVRSLQGASSQPTLALVATTSTSAVAQSARSLFRTLFLIALGGTLLALLLASAVGDSVGAGLRRLTLAADAIRRGERGVRAGLGTGDEVDALGAAFDSMVTSIDDKTAALSQAAYDEARLRGRLEAVVAGMGEALVAVDGNGRVTDFNQAAEEVIGVSAAIARGEPVDEVVALFADDGTDLSAQLRRPPDQRWSVQAWV